MSARVRAPARRGRVYTAGADERPPAGLRERVPLAPLTTLGIGGPARWFARGGERVRRSSAGAGVGGGRSRCRSSCSAAAATCWSPTRASRGWCCAWRFAGCAEEPRRRRGAAARGGRREPGTRWWSAPWRRGSPASSACRASRARRARRRSRTSAPTARRWRRRSWRWRRWSRDGGARAALRRRRVRLRLPRQRLQGRRARPLGDPGGDLPAGAGGAAGGALRRAGAPPGGRDGRRADVDLARVRAAVLALRRRKGMVLDPDDPDTRSDGSFFINPVVPAAALDDVPRRASRRAAWRRRAVPRFAAARRRQALRRRG